MMSGFYTYYMIPTRTMVYGYVRYVDTPDYISDPDISLLASLGAPIAHQPLASAESSLQYGTVRYRTEFCEQMTNSKP